MTNKEFKINLTADQLNKDIQSYIKNYKFKELEEIDEFIKRITKQE